MDPTVPVDRRTFFAVTARGGARLAAMGLSLPALLAACGRDEPAIQGSPPTQPASPDQGSVLVGDVLDHRLRSDEWEGAFGFVTFRLTPGSFEGQAVYLIRTDASDEAFARDQRLVFVPKLASLDTDGLAGEAFLVAGGTDDQALVVSSEPGRADYTPAWRVRNVTWTAEPRTLASVGDVRAAESAGEIRIEPAGAVMNAAIVKWSSGELPADGVLKEYLGDGPLIEPPDADALTVTFKLNECFPGSRYIVTEHSIEPAAEMTHTAFAPRLHGGPSEAGATGRTNVFMNGIPGPGPMGFQPSAFDLAAGDPGWSPYWDHYTYAWKDSVEPRVLKSQREVHAARDAGELEEFPGVPDTKGEVFTVNCPVPVLAESSFTG
ncbi:MAG: hypothetical protein LC722_08555 [Actinobacteria bacterium]|nr:hypothetical protein [Actinomycetota bacterium]